MSRNDAAAERLRSFIVNRRHDLRLSQPQLAKLAGVPQSTIGSFEAGRSGIPRHETLVSLARGLGVPFAVIEGVLAGEPQPQVASVEATLLAQRLLRLPPEARAAIEAVMTGFERTLNQP